MRKFLALVAVVIVLLAAAAAVVAWRGWNDLHEPYKGYTGAEQFVTIRQGASSSEIGRQLAAVQVVRDATCFGRRSGGPGGGRSLKAGEYPLRSPADAARGARCARARRRLYARLTFPEGLNIEEMAKLDESHGFGRASDFVEAASNVKRITRPR